VVDYLVAAPMTWLGEYHCDGIRVDSAHTLPPDFVRYLTRSGTAVHVESIHCVFNAPGIERLKLEHDKLLTVLLSNSTCAAKLSPPPVPGPLHHWRARVGERQGRGVLSTTTQSHMRA